MNYISIIDQLNLDIEAISDLDNNKIIRLQKQLKAKAVLENSSNLGQLASMIDELKDETIRKHHIFVEKHQWLKQIITGDYSNIPQSSIKIHHESIANNDSLKQFLVPYLKAHIKPFLAETLNKGKYILLINIVLSQRLFTEEIEQMIISFFSSKLNYAKVYMEEGKLEDKHYPVAYITNRNFIKCLSQYPNSFEDDINELNSVVIDIYNSKRKNTNNSTFIFTAKAMVAFGELEISNYMLKDVLISNAATAKPYAFKTGKSQKTKSGTGVGIWSIIVFLILMVRIATKVFRSDSSSPSNYYDQYDRINIGNTNENNKNILEAIRKIQEKKQLEQQTLGSNNSKNNNIEETVILKNNNTIKTITLPNIYGNRYKSKNHIRFIYSLKLKTKREDQEKNPKPTTPITAFTNAYPKTFNTIESSENRVNNYSLLKNNTNKDLVVFRLTQGIDQTIYIPNEETRYINIKQGDSLLFYTGQYFSPGRFSHFKTQTELSKLYKVKTLETGTNTEINILPFSQEVKFNKDFKTNKTTIDTFLRDHIKTNKLELESLNIDYIYTKWYKNKYN
ncbi:hypothetical protein [uncultured Olleya sp.]|uniref:hypothetical protein n=1 Tax=uncultured Olleya sp. TaxID=757243 RepID=UPI0025915A7D|nr:hypothetical protein [uncultured Olleya sp.]